MIMGIPHKAVACLPRVEGIGDYGVLARNRAGEHILYRYATEDHRDLGYSIMVANTFYSRVTKWNVI